MLSFLNLINPMLYILTLELIYTIWIDPHGLAHDEYANHQYLP